MDIEKIFEIDEALDQLLDIIDELTDGMDEELAYATSVSIAAALMDQYSIKYGRDPAEVRAAILTIGPEVDINLQECGPWLSI